MIDQKKPRITLIMVMSANGVAAQEMRQDSFEWNSKEDRQQFLKRIKKIGAVLMGGNTYQTIQQQPYEGVDFYVLTRNSSRFKSHPRVEFLQDDVNRVCENLWKIGVKQLALLGGPETNSQFFDKGLIDEIYLTIEPLLLPKGTHLIASPKFPTDLCLKSVTPLANSSTLLLYYRLKNSHR